MISRVFQKTGRGGGASGGAHGGAKKGRGGVTLYPDQVSQHLPPLLDSSPYGGGAATESHSYDGGETSSTTIVTKQEHVSCFSTTNVNNNMISITNFNPFELTTTIPSPPPPQPRSASGGRGGYDVATELPAFPNLRSLQENLHLPAFQGGEGGDFSLMLGGGRVGVGGGPATELDCMWSY